jgi:hypothetical protein
VNPISQTHWEGVGVKPDIAVPSSQALRRAQIELLRTPVAAERAESRRRTLQQRLTELEQGKAAD